MANAQGRIFNTTFNNEGVLDIEFDVKWKNGTGYLDGACAANLERGEMRKCFDDLGRRVILIGTRFGTIAVFDRYSKQHDDGVYVINTPSSPTIKAMVDRCGGVGEADMLRLMGGWGIIRDNIGAQIEHMAEEFKLFD